MTPTFPAPGLDGSPNLAAIMHQLVAQNVKSSEAQSELVAALTENARRTHEKSKMETPKLGAQNAMELQDELRFFSRYCTEYSVISKKKWFTLARNVASGKAKRAIEDMVVRDFGGEKAYTVMLENGDDGFWSAKWDQLEQRLRIKAGAEGTTELEVAQDTYNRVTLAKNADADGVEAFILQYEAARTLMIQQGLLSDHSDLLKTQEFVQFREKVEGTKLAGFLEGLPDYPTIVDDTREEFHRVSLLGRCRQYVRVLRKEKGEGEKAILLDSTGSPAVSGGIGTMTGSFLKTQVGKQFTKQVAEQALNLGALRQIGSVASGKTKARRAVENRKLEGRSGREGSLLDMQGQTPRVPSVSELQCQERRPV